MSATDSSLPPLHVPIPELNFESAMRRLELIVEKLDAGKTPLEEAVRLFEEGKELQNHCQQVLNKFEERINTANLATSDAT